MKPTFAVSYQFRDVSTYVGNFRQDHALVQRIAKRAKRGGFTTFVLRIKPKSRFTRLCAAIARKIMP